MLRFLATLFNYSAYFDNFAHIEFGIIMILVGFYMYYEIFVARPVQFHFKPTSKIANRLKNGMPVLTERFKPSM